MKKYISLLMIIVLCIAATAGCQKNDRSESGTQVSEGNSTSLTSDIAEDATITEDGMLVFFCIGRVPQDT